MQLFHNSVFSLELQVYILYVQDKLKIVTFFSNFWVGANLPLFLSILNLHIAILILPQNSPLTILFFFLRILSLYFQILTSSEFWVYLALKKKRIVKSKLVYELRTFNWGYKRAILSIWEKIQLWDLNAQLKTLMLLLTLFSLFLRKQASKRYWQQQLDPFLKKLIISIINYLLHLLHYLFMHLFTILVGYALRETCVVGHNRSFPIGRHQNSIAGCSF